MAYYWKILRLNFIFFSLYLIGDAFYRWDGFSYYAPLSEFLPGAALVLILCSVLAVLISIFLWSSFKTVNWLCRRAGRQIKEYDFLIFLCCFVIAGTLILTVKHFLYSNDSTLHLKLAVTLLILLAAFFLTRFVHGRLSVNSMMENMTPLVWLFGIMLFLSVPLVAYHMWIKDRDTVSNNYSQISADKDRPNIILLTFDALTAMDMSLYGYQRETTPFISKWAKTSSSFTGAHAASNHTSSTLASLMTGKRVWTHQVYHMPVHSKPVRSDVENLAFVLKKNDYYTMAYVENTSALPETLGISQSFHDVSISSPDLYYKAWLYRFFGDKIQLYDWIIQKDFHLTFFLRYILNSLYTTDLLNENMDSVKNANRSLHSDWLLSYGPPEPFFAWIHVLPPHSPYLPPEPFLGMFADVPEKGKYRKQSDAEERNEIRARYDEFIRYCDKLFKDFIGRIHKHGKLENTILVLSADHGEIFDHKSMTHGSTLYEPETHIPLVIREPGQTGGLVIDEAVAQIDIPATILDLVNIAVPPWMEGRSLKPLLRGEEFTSAPVFSMNFKNNRSLGHKITRGIIAVREGKYKLIHDLSEKKSLLFNLKEDPYEQNNLFDKETGVGQHLLNIIFDNLKEANERIKKEE